MPRSAPKVADVQVAVAAGLVVGAFAVLLWGFELLPGGWLGIDVLLGLLGLLAAVPAAVPSVDPSAGRGRREWWPAAVTAVVGALVLVAMSAASGRFAASSPARGDLLAAVGSLGDVRAGFEGTARHAGSAGSIAGTIWVASLLLHGLGLAALLRWAGRVSGRRTACGLAAAGLVFALGLLVAGLGGSLEHLLSGPAGRLAGVGLGYAVGAAGPQLVAWRHAPTATWIAAAVVVLGVVAAPVGVAVLAVVLPPVVAGAAATLVLTAPAFPLPGVVRRLASSGAAVATAIVVVVAGGAIVGVVRGTSGSRPLAAVGALVALAVAIGVGVAATAAGVAVPRASWAVAGPPVVVLALLAPLLTTGFFHAEPVVRVRTVSGDELRDNVGPYWSLAADIPYSARFCRSTSAERLSRRLGEVELADVDVSAANRLRDEKGPLRTGDLLGLAPRPLRSSIRSVVARFDDLAKYRQFVSHVPVDVREDYQRLTVYLITKCDLPVRA